MKVVELWWHDELEKQEDENNQVSRAKKVLKWSQQSNRTPQITSNAQLSVLGLKTAQF